MTHRHHHALTYAAATSCLLAPLVADAQRAPLPFVDAWISSAVQ